MRNAEGECWQSLRAGSITLVGTRSGRGIRCRRRTVRRRRHRLRPWSIRHGGHRTLRIQKMVLARPSLVGLVAAHSLFAGLVPCARSFPAEVMFADQGFLNGLGSLGIDFLLAAGTL